ncbi:uncharacterized protein LOC127289123 isoform X2 [Leptopilina boulardi]|uniref:uncharacterized protein LOC127289123 isoform X2 n=1 Tax=Leptopilina boulardi TaxID=63433 RepID=UPI0021F5DF4D|nr:uncharacterized protein LOC127289123 isoform X2 [Leptopilina boulardi]
MDIVQKPYYKVTRYIIIVIGLSRHHPMWFNLFSKFYILFIYLSFIVFQVAGLVKSFGNVDMILECMSPICYVSMSTILYINNILQVKQINVIFWKIKTDWDTLTSEAEVDILHKYGRKCQIYTIIYTLGIFGNVIFYYFTHGIPLLINIFQNSNKPKPLLFLIYCGVDSQKYYYLILFYSYLVGWFCSYSIASGATLLVMFLEHACGIFDIIGHKLSIAIKENPDSFNDISSRKKLKREINLCVSMHRKVLLFINDIQTVLSTPYLFVFGCCILLLSTTGVQYVMNMKESGDGMRFGVYVICQVFHIFLLTLPTQHLLDNSLNLSSSMIIAFIHI